MEGLGKALKKHMEIARPPKTRSGQQTLDTAVRIHIFKAMIESPGLTVPDIARVVSKGETTVRWHVRKMEKADLVQSVKDSGRVRYSPIGIFSTSAES